MDSHAQQQIYENKMAIKVFGTLRPSSLDRETVQKLEQAGVNLFRINLSHAPLEDLGEVLRNLSK